MAEDETRLFLQGTEGSVLLSRETIAARVKELGKAVSRDFEGTRPVIIGVLNGSFIFFADLVRELTIDCEVDFIKISSYGKAAMSTGWIHLSKDVETDITGRQVLVVEDIVDTGRSVRYLKERLERLKPSSLDFVSLLVKEGRPEDEFPVRYTGFRIPRRFVVGYGLDRAYLLRNLPAVYTAD